MSKVERKEYQETKILRTVSPARTAQGASGQNLAQFDNNLDYLLDDLQSSVPRSNAGSNTYRETRVVTNVDPGRSNSLTRVTHLKASNPVTEYPDDYNYAVPDSHKNVKSYKKETYSYSSTGDRAPPEKIRMQNNINQLDSLLDDLKQVKQSGPINNTGIDPGLVEPTRTKVIMGKKTVERELHYGDTPPRATTRSEREGSVTREIQYVDEGTYGETRPIRYTTPSPSHSQTSTLSKQKQITNVQTYPVAVVETTTPDINPEILANLDPNLLPSGNTKVTTTIKTYTYEIPGAGYKPTTSPEPEKYVYSPNQATTPSKSFVYTKVDNDDVTDTVHYPPPAVYKETTTTTTQNAPPYQRPTSPPGTGTTIIKETTRNYQPGYRPEPQHHPPNKQTYIYNETTTTTTTKNNVYPDDPHGRNRGYPDEPPVRPDNRGYPEEPYHDDPNYPGRHPPRNETYIYKETHNTSNVPPYNNGYPPQEPGHTTVIYKHDTHTTNYNTPPSPRQVPPNTTVIINKTERNTTDNYDPNYYPPHSGRPNEPPYSRRPNEPPYSRNPNEPPYSRNPNEPPYDPNNVNITYKYTTHSSTANNYKGYPPNEESQPLLRPQPFPHDGDSIGPPKRVDELMANIGREPPDSPLNQGFSVHEAELIHQKKVDNLKQQKEANDLQKKERTLQPTKNITGPPVYYPPGEMFAKKEESGGGAWRAEGAMARESGRYKYESESSSRVKTAGGAAVVPLCLPCCCGLPCTII